MGTDQEFKVHLYNGVAINKSGYLYIYVSNETPNIDVFFDNLQVTHVRGPMVEETHYYAFGLTMGAIKSNAFQFGEPDNKQRYNGKEEQRKEFSDGSGLEWLDYEARMYDFQIGRWHLIDALAEEFHDWTPYNYVYNNPIKFIDPDGKSPSDSIPISNVSDGYQERRDQYIQAVNTKAKNSEKIGGPLFDFTFSITKGELGTFAFRTELGNVGVGFSQSVDETDVIGIRNNELQVGGTEASTKEDVKRNEISASVLGFGGGESTEERSLHGTSTTKKSTTTISVPLVDAKTTNDNNNRKSDMISVNVLNVKVAFIVGVEANFNINLNLNCSASPIPFQNAARDNTRYVPAVLPNTRVRK